MTPGPESAALAIAGMALVSYGARAMGLVVTQLLPSSPWVTAFLKHLGGAVIVALVAASLARGDTAGIIATAFAVLVASRGRPTAAIIGGMAIAAALRAL